MFTLTQTHLSFPACNLILSSSSEQNPLTTSKGTAKFWCEAANNARIQHESVFNLKLKMLDSSSNSGDPKDSKQVEEMIVKEINNRPSEVSPRLQLVNYYISKSRPEDAFKYISDLMTRSPGQFMNSLDWYAAVHKALNLYRHATDVVLAKNWDYWLLSITALDRQLSLALAQDHNLATHQSGHLSHCQSLLFELDQQLYTAANISFPVRAELSAQMITHFQGQFLLHAASFLFKRERTLHLNQWWTTTNHSLPLLFIAFRLGIASTEDGWLKSANDATKELVRLWQRQGAFRCCQAGRTLLSCVQVGGGEDGKSTSKTVAPFNLPDEVTDAARRQCASRNWTTSLFRHLFPSDEHASKTSTSFMVTSNLLAEPTFELPTALRVQMYERIAEALQSDSLPQLVYLYLHNEKLSECDFNVFHGLELTTSNIFNCSAATLNKLDIETFLIATVVQTKARLTAEAQSGVTDGPRPTTMPFANMSRVLCTEEQLRWWQSAYSSSQGSPSDAVAPWNVREVLQDGIEAVRCVGSPKMDLMMALLTGDVLKQKTDHNVGAIDVTTRKAYEQRVENIFQCALHLFKNQATSSVAAADKQRRLFQFGTGTTTTQPEECETLLEGAIIFLAEQLFKAGDYDACVEALTNVQLPYATYYIAEAYKRMDESQRNNRTPPRSGNYQNKVKQFLGQTQKLLASASKRGHSLRTVVSNELKKMQYSDLNSSIASVDDDLNLSYSGGHSLNRSSRQQDSHVVVDQVANLTALVTQLSMQNTMLQTEMSDIKKMLQQQKDTAAATPPPPAAAVPPSVEAMFRLEEQQRMAALASLASHQSPHYDFMNGRYSVGGYPSMAAYPGLPFPGPGQYSSPHMRSYAQDAALAMAQANTGLPIYDPMTGSLALPPPVVPPQQQQQQQVPLYYSPGNANTATTTNAGQHSTLAGQLQQPPIPLATSSTLNQQSLGEMFPGAGGGASNSILKTWNSTYNNEPVEKTAPANVVITSSDPVPMHNTVTAQKLLSVTIPPQHIKNFGQTTHAKTESQQQQQFPTVLSGAFNSSQGASSLSHTATNISGDETATEDGYYGEEYGDEYVQQEEVQEVTPTVVKRDVSVAAVNDLPAKAPIAVNDDFNFSFGATGSAAAPPAAKPSPFSGFSFGGTAAAANVVSPEKPFSSLFGNIPRPTVGDSLFGLRPAATAPTQQPTAEASPSRPNEDAEDEYVPTAHFKPVIELPSLIDVKTGEEDENVAFEHRAKLLRFDPTTKEWKERGLGNIRLLVRKDDPSQVRLLMRREQVLKLACNQRVAKDQEFQKMKGSETALSWFAQDYAENELKPELFAIRFKTSDTCKAFHEAILEAQRNMVVKADVPKVTQPGKKDEPKKGFGDLFKKQVGSWECKACLIVNKSDTLHCVACDSPKDDTVPKKEAKPQGLDLTKGVTPGKFSFGFGVKPAAAAAVAPVDTVPQASETANGFGDAFKPKAGSWECQACYITNKGDDSHCISCATGKDGSVGAVAAAPSLTFGASSTSGFSFGAAAANKSSFSFGSPSTTTLFSSTITTGSGLFGQTDAAVPAPTNGPTFGMEAKPSFNFVFTPKSPGKGKSPQKMTNGAAATGDDDAESGDENIEEEENTAYFAPVIPLPDKVDAKTGEEDETVLYSHRAKLFRYTDGEWKERGLGDVKVLKHNVTGKLRVVMRREQVLKICLNHVLDADVEYGVKDNKSWHFVVNDFSEGVFELAQFALRFKTPEIANDFMAVVKEEVGGDGNASLLETSAHVEDGGVTADTEQLINQLKLPQGFFDEAEPCSGCRGCNDEDFVFTDINTAAIKTVCDDLPLRMPELPATVQKPNDLAKSIFGGFNQTLGTTTTFGAAASESSGAAATTNIFGGATMFSGSPTKPTSGTIFGGSLFGGSGGATTTLFGSAVAPAKTATPEKSATGTNLFSGLNNSFGSGTTESPGSFAFGSPGLNASASVAAPSIGGSINSTAETIEEPRENALTKSPATIFGQHAFGTTPASTMPAFGSFSFGTAKQAQPLVEKKEEENSQNPVSEEPAKEPIFTMDSNFSFASLAQQEPGSVFGGGATAAGAPVTVGFFGLSNMNDFRHFDRPQNNGNGEAEEEAAEDANYDPHYEPIIALPEEIAVSTGEEEETKLFGERGCLYRYDSTNKEWKERGKVRLNNREKSFVTLLFNFRCGRVQNSPPPGEGHVPVRDAPRADL